MEELSTVTVNCKNICKIFTQNKLTEFFIVFCCIFQIFRKIFCKIRKLSYMNFYRNLVTWTVWSIALSRKFDKALWNSLSMKLENVKSLLSFYFGKNFSWYICFRFFIVNVFVVKDKLYFTVMVLLRLQGVSCMVFNKITFWHNISSNIPVNVTISCEILIKNLKSDQILGNLFIKENTNRRVDENSNEDWVFVHLSAHFSVYISVIF